MGKRLEEILYNKATNMEEYRDIMSLRGILPIIRKKNDIYCLASYDQFHNLNIRISSLARIREHAHLVGIKLQ